MNELEREGRNLRWESSSPNCLTLGVNSALSLERRWTRARDFLVIPGILDRGLLEIQTLAYLTADLRNSVIGEGGGGEAGAVDPWMATMAIVAIVIG